MEDDKKRQRNEGETDARVRKKHFVRISLSKKSFLAAAMVIVISLFAFTVPPLGAVPTPPWGDEPLHATVTPIPVTGSLSVSSSPSDATIILDGFSGPPVKTPYTFNELLIGTHTVELSLEGYVNWSTSAVVKAGETTHIHAPLSPIPTTGSLSLSSSPSGATIIVDGSVIPSVATPYTVTNVSMGTHTIDLSLEGYESWSASVEVIAGETLPVHGTLTPIPTPPPTTGAIAVTSSPSGAMIALEASNGTSFSAITPYTFTDMLPDTYSIILLLPDYESWSTSVVLSAGETTTVHATLTPGHIKINEIMYNPPHLDANREWIELYNSGSCAVNLTGWQLFEGFPTAMDHELTLVQGSMVIPPGGYAIIADNAAVFLNEHPTSNCTVFDTRFILSNMGEWLALKNPAFEIIDEVTYHDLWGADGNGRTLELNVTGEWEESLVDGGTPCHRNSVIIVPP